MLVGEGRSKGYSLPNCQERSGALDTTMFSLILPVVHLPLGFMLKMVARHLHSPFIFVCVVGGLFNFDASTLAFKGGPFERKSATKEKTICGDKIIKTTL